jgi:hypothetical protein
VNKYSGKWLLAAGLSVTLAAAGFSIVPGITVDFYAYAILGVWVVMFAVAIIASVRYMNSL